MNENEQWLYVISELSNELFIVDMNRKEIVQTLSIIEKDCESVGAAIRLSRDGKHLYTTTRGQNLLKHFVYQENWKEVQRIHLDGDGPRDFNLFENFILVGYQNSPYVEKIYLDEKQRIYNKKERISYYKIVCIK